MENEYKEDLADENDSEAKVGDVEDECNIDYITNLIQAGNELENFSSNQQLDQINAYISEIFELSKNNPILARKILFDNEILHQFLSIIQDLDLKQLDIVLHTIVNVINRNISTDLNSFHETFENLQNLVTNLSSNAGNTLITRYILQILNRMCSIKQLKLSEDIYQIIIKICSSNFMVDNSSLEYEIANCCNELIKSYQEEVDSEFASFYLGWCLSYNGNKFVVLPSILSILEKFPDLISFHIKKITHYIGNLIYSVLHKDTQEFRNEIKDFLIFTKFFVFVLNYSSQRYYLKLMKLGFVQSLEIITNCFVNKDIESSLDLIDIFDNICEIIAIIMSASADFAVFFVETVQIFANLIEYISLSMNIREKKSIVNIFGLTSRTLPYDMFRSIFGKIEIISIVVSLIYEVDTDLAVNAINGLKILLSVDNDEIFNLTLQIISEEGILDDDNYDVDDAIAESIDDLAQFIESK